MKKICLSLLLSIILICQCLSVSTVIAADVLTPEAELLAAIGLLKGDANGDFRLNDTITRAEYTALILRMLGHESLSTQMGNTTSFSDVPESHWASGYIRLASEMKLVNGMGNNRFEPDREVNFQEAVKIMVCALGYGPLAEKDGGFYQGYSKWAIRLKLLNGVRTSGQFTRKDACSLIENALTVDIVGVLGDVVSGENILTKCLDLTQMRGTVTATEGVGGENLGKGYIEISGKRYKTRHILREELFACEVEFYVFERNSGEEEIYYIKVMEDENRLDISYKDILPTTTLSTFKYRNNKNTVTKNLSDSLVIYYNGEKVTSKNMNQSLLMPDIGNVVLCDAGKDNVYDVAIVTSYRTMVVNYYGHETIYDVYGNHLSVTPEKTQVFYGEDEIELENLQKGDIICVAVSLSGEKAKIYKTDEVLGGYIYEKGTNEDGETFYGIKLEDESVREAVVSKSFLDAISLNKAPDILKISKQKIYVALNYFGEIADAWNDEITDPLGLRYGFLIDAGIKGDFGDELKIKLLTANNRFEVLQIPQNGRITFGRMDNGIYKETKETASAVKTLLGGNSIDRSLVRYRLNEEGKLTQLYLPDESQNPNNFSEDVSRYFATYRQGVLDQKYLLSSNTVVFSMPEGDTYEAVMAAGKYQSFLSDGQSRYCTLYDVDNGVVGAVVIHGAPAVRYDSNEEGFEKTLSYASSPVLFISDSGYTRAEDGDSYKNVRGFQDGKEVSVMLADNLSEDVGSMSQLTAGTVVQYETNSYTKLNALNAQDPEQMIMFQKIFDFNNNQTSGILWDHDIIVKTAPEIMTVWGVLSDVDPAYITIEVEDDSNTIPYVMAVLGNSTFMKYDSDEMKFSLINAKEIVPGQRVYLCRRGNKQDIVVY